MLNTVPSDSSSPILRPREWVIEGILPTRVIALLVGSPGVGKTSGVVNWLAGIQSGIPVFEHATSRTGVVWVSCDRSEEEHYAHLDALGHPPTLFPFHDQTLSPTSLPVILRACARNYPNHRLIFIDGFARLIPDSKLSDYGAVAEVLCEGGGLCRELNLTVIGSVHTAKEKDGQGYSDPRSQALGSTAWTAYSNLTIVIQRKNPRDPSDPLRTVSVLTRASAGDLVFPYQKDPSSPGGALIPYEDASDAELLDFYLLGLPFDQPIPKSAFMQYASEKTIPTRSLERWLGKQTDLGLLERIRKGVYHRRRKA